MYEGVFMDVTYYNDDARTRYERYVAEHHILTMQALEELLQKLLNFYDRFVVLGLFEGLGGEGYTELFHVKLHQFHDDGTMTTFLGRTIQVSDRLVEAGKRAYTENAYRSYDAENSLKPMLDSRFALRKFLDVDLSDDAKKTAHIDRLLQTIFAYTGYTGYTVHDLQVSGILCFVHKAAKALNMTQKYYLKSRATEILVQYPAADLEEIKREYIGYFDF